MNLPVKTLLIVAALLLAGILYIPNVIRARVVASMDTCQFHLMWIEMAKREWAREEGKSAGDTPSETELLSFMREITPMWCGSKRRRDVPPDHLPTCVVTDLPYTITPLHTPMECPRAEVHDRKAGWMKPALAYHYGVN